MEWTNEGPAGRADDHYYLPDCQACVAEVWKPAGSSDWKGCVWTPGGGRILGGVEQDTQHLLGPYASLKVAQARVKARAVKERLVGPRKPRA